MIPAKLCKGGIIYQCKSCNKVYRLGEWVSISLVLQLKAKVQGCTFIELDCGCGEEICLVGFA